MEDLQVWLVSTLSSVGPVARLMRTHWAWPIAESIHFVGLSLLIGCIGAFDLRLLGVARGIPIAALHKLIPVGLTGYAINVASGALFLMTEPDQYIYNPAFHFKLLFMAIAGFNATMFYVIAYQKAASENEAPRAAKIIAATSLAMWIAVIVCGRLLTFYRPGPCGPDEAGLLAHCIPR
jgi:hypothetical protein